MQKIRPDLNLGFTLQKIRNERKMTQDAVVQKMQLMGLSISRGVYAKIETNRMNIRVGELLALIHIFQVTLDDVFADCKQEFQSYLQSL